MLQSLDSNNSDNSLSGKMATQQGAIAVASDVRNFGDVFVNNYYRVFVLSPQSLYRFYKDSSTFGRSNPNGKMVSVTAMEAIKELITSMDYSALNVKIKSVDSQACYNKGVVVCVTRSIRLALLIYHERVSYLVLRKCIMYD